MGNYSRSDRARSNPQQPLQLTRQPAPSGTVPALQASQTLQNITRASPLLQVGNRGHPQTCPFPHLRPSDTSLKIRYAVLWPEGFQALVLTKCLTPPDSLVFSPTAAVGLLKWRLFFLPWTLGSSVLNHSGVCYCMFALFVCLRQDLSESLAVLDLPM